MRPIRFGTSGWRGIIADEITFERVRVVTAAIAEHLREKGGEEVAVGFDTRFLSDRFADLSAETLAERGLSVFLSEGPVPTPVVSSEILSRRLSGGVNITASHNPAAYNGIKFSPAWGGPALPEETQGIEDRANRMLQQGDIPPSVRPAAERIQKVRMGEAYRRALDRYIDPRVFSGWPVVIDLFYGTAQGYLDRFLREAGAELNVLHGGYNPGFDGLRPDPEGGSLDSLVAQVKKGNYPLGLATDCDADRFGVIDQGGSYIPPNAIIALLLDYLVRQKGMKGNVARSCATSHLVDAVAASHGLQVIETPVGFKYIGERIARDELLIGGEESGGISIRGHLPEKDGILTSLLVAEMVARHRVSLSTMLAELTRKVGAYYNRRIDLPLSPAEKSDLMTRLDRPPDRFAGQKVIGVDRLDGLRLSLEGGGWVLIRPSGTEPVVRFYMESPIEKDIAVFQSAFRRDFLSSKTPG